MKRAVGVVAALALLVAGGGALLALRLAGSSPRSTALPPLVGFRVNQAVPDVPLLGEDGKPTTLGAFRGKVVVLSPFLTLCHEVCPITTGAFLQMERDVAQAGLAGRVVFVEMTTDPWRDTPARLRAFVRLTGIDFPLLTGSPANIRAIWNFFGIGYVRVPQGAHPDLDWWTGKRETFDVQHVDGLFFIDPSGHERIFMEGMPDEGSTLSPALRALLNRSGLANLEHPSGAWTLSQALDDLGHVLGRPIPAVGR